MSLVCLPLQLILADVLCLSKHCLWVTLMCKTYFDCKCPFITCCKQSHPYLPYISSLWQQIRGYFHCRLEALQFFVFASYLGKHGLDRKEKISKKESTIFAKENNARTRKRRKMWAKNKDKEGLGEKMFTCPLGFPEADQLPVALGWVSKMKIMIYIIIVINIMTIWYCHRCHQNYLVPGRVITRQCAGPGGG